MPSAQLIWVVPRKGYFPVQSLYLPVPPLYSMVPAFLEPGAGLPEGIRQVKYVGAMHDVSIPPTLRDSLMARLDRVAAVKEIAQIGAAIGREFRYELIADVVSMTQAPLDAVLAQHH